MTKPVAADPKIPSASPQRLGDGVRAAVDVATPPAVRLALALAAVHAGPAEGSA
ncbi:hypothetical protein ACWGDE_17670 [Streptomyces sp. NPDC054956]